MRAWFYTQVKAVLNDMADSPVPPSRVISAGSTTDDPGDPPDRPFLIIRTLTLDPPLANVAGIVQRRFQTWVHDDLGSYVGIDDVLSTFMTALPTLAPQQIAGWNIMECSWQGEGPDSYDDMYKTNTRYAEFLVTGKKTA